MLDAFGGVRVLLPQEECCCTTAANTSTASGTAPILLIHLPFCHVAAYSLSHPKQRSKPGTVRDQSSPCDSAAKTRLLT